MPRLNFRDSISRLHLHKVPIPGYAPKNIHKKYALRLTLFYFLKFKISRIYAVHVQLFNNLSVMILVLDVTICLLF